MPTSLFPCPNRRFPSPPSEAEYAEPSLGVGPGFFSCANCFWFNPQIIACGFNKWSKSPPFSVVPRGCCRYFRNDLKLACGPSPEEP